MGRDMARILKFGFVSSKTLKPDSGSGYEPSMPKCRNARQFEERYLHHSTKRGKARLSNDRLAEPLYQITVEKNSARQVPKDKKELKEASREAAERCELVQLVIQSDR
ncbi:hypothetical protein NX059_010101 [Plenodomus lindquistii]|nr:hypothetical protein NX059_010101 [Plenodomus lindquistii]